MCFHEGLQGGEVSWRDSAIAGYLWTCQEGAQEIPVLALLAAEGAAACQCGEVVVQGFLAEC